MYACVSFLLKITTCQTTLMLLQSSTTRSSIVKYFLKIKPQAAIDQSPCKFKVLLFITTCIYSISCKCNLAIQGNHYKMKYMVMNANKLHVFMSEDYTYTGIHCLKQPPPCCHCMSHSYQTCCSSHRMALHHCIL